MTWGEFKKAVAAAAAIDAKKAARARLTRLKNEYARVGREEGWDSPKAKAAEQKMLAAQRS